MDDDEASRDVLLDLEEPIDIEFFSLAPPLNITSESLQCNAPPVLLDMSEDSVRLVVEEC